MQHWKYPAALLAALVGAAFAHGPAAAQAGFVCGKAITPTEKAICGDAEIAASDRAMSMAYAALAERADRSLEPVLRKDQNDFLDIRSQAFESPRANEALRQERLRNETAERAELLNWISTTPARSLIGNWYNAWGAITVTQGASGRLNVELDVADQANGSWVCSFAGEVEQAGPGEARYEGEGGPLVIRLDGAALNIPTPFCDASTSGGFGSAQGHYFQVNAE